jgi:TonB family protein
MKNFTLVPNQLKNYIFSPAFFAIIGVFCFLTACESPKKPEEAITDTLKVAVDTPKVGGNGTNGMVKPDTTPKQETIVTPPPVKVEPVKVDTKNSQTGGDKPRKPKPEVEKEPTDIVTVPDELAAPMGGYPAFYRGHVKDNLKYPEQAIKEGIEGRVALQFIVSKDGSVSNVKVTQGIGAGCDEEAVRILKQSPKWQPAVHQGKPVKSKATIFISFKIK